MSASTSGCAATSASSGTCKIRLLTTGSTSTSATSTTGEWSEDSPSSSDGGAGLRAGATILARVRIHLVDATYELFRAYYGAPPARAPDGREVGAVRGLLRTLLALLHEDGVSHVACAFDHVIRSEERRVGKEGSSRR